MMFNPDHHRRSIRLKDYDYAQGGAYYVTICTFNREPIFGEIVDYEMRLNDYGRVVEEEWLVAPNKRNDVELDAYVVMPNHFHGILLIDRRGTVHRAPTSERFGKPTSDSLPTIVRYFKSAVTRRIRVLRGDPAAVVWQRKYYEHVIRDETELNEKREYIVGNPLKWDLDSENPNAGSRCTVPLHLNR
ncbi:MAG: transposase [Chloroflexi bacterium]|nr:transposase [Chloroflexota bacterium]